MKSNVQFTKIRDVKSPNRAHSTDAGSDFFIPNYSDEFFAALKEKNKGNKLIYQMTVGDNGQELEITILPGEQVNIPSGIKVNILDKDTFLECKNKSGVASKYHLDVMACIIDADYQGEIHLNFVNTGNENVTIKTGQKIVQLIQQHYLDTQWEEITTDEYDSLEVSSRSDGSFGSSGIF